MSEDETFVEEPDDFWDGDLLTPEMRLRAKTCYGCERVVEWDDLVSGRCPTGDCSVTNCPHCGYEWCSIGPILCKACGGMSFWYRQYHRVDMWWFDHAVMPMHQAWRWMKRAVFRR